MTPPPFDEEFFKKAVRDVRNPPPEEQPKYATVRTYRWYEPETFESRGETITTWEERRDTVTIPDTDAKDIFRDDDFFEREWALMEQEIYEARVERAREQYAALSPHMEGYYERRTGVFEEEYRLIELPDGWLVKYTVTSSGSEPYYGWNDISPEVYSTRLGIPDRDGIRGAGLRPDNEYGMSGSDLWQGPDEPAPWNVAETPIRADEFPSGARTIQ